MPACVEAVTYLSTRPGGATTQEVADALGITDGRVRQDMSIVRAWLGDNPHTGRKFLPGATEHPRAIERGVGLYLIEDLLCDADLFKRLRLRGEARGPRRSRRPAHRAPAGQRRPLRRDTNPRRRLARRESRSTSTCCAASSTSPTSCPPSRSRPATLQQARAAAELAVLTAPSEATTQFDLAAIAAKTGDQRQGG